MTLMSNHPRPRLLSEFLKDPPTLTPGACAFYGYNHSWFYIQHPSDGPFSCSLDLLKHLNHPNAVATAMVSNHFTFATLPTLMQLQDIIRDQVHSYSAAVWNLTARKVVLATPVEAPRPIVVATLFPEGTNGTDETEPAHLNLASDDAKQQIDQHTEEYVQQQDEESSVEPALGTDHSQVNSALQLLTNVAEHVLTKKKRCQLCGTRNSPRWRIKGRYCNACGLKHMRSPDYEPSQKRSRDANLVQLCEFCGTDDTPRWRCNGTLCNACGLKKMKKRRFFLEDTTVG